VTRVDKVSPFVQLDYGPPGTLFKRPRLWRLTIGLSIAAGAAAITWITGLLGWQAAPPDMNLSLSLGFLSLGGIAIAMYAVVRDLLHVEWARFSADGLQIRWSYVPHLWDTRVAKEQQWAWRDVVHLEWREGSLEYDLKQHLVLHLEPPLAVGRNRLKLLVCDDLNAGRCEALMAQLPTGVVTPSWLAATRSRRQDNAAYST